MAARRTVKRLVLAAMTLIVLGLIFIALIPTLLNQGMARGTILAAIDKQVNGTSHIDQLGLSWFGEQHVNGLTITEPNGRQAVNVNVTVPASLLSLALGSVDPLHADIDGMLAGELRKDGALSLLEIPKSKDDQKKETQPKDEKKTKDDAQGLTVNIRSLNVELAFAGGHDDRTLKLNDLKGSVAYLPGKEVSLTLDGAAITESPVAPARNGNVAIDLRADGLIDRTGKMTPDGARVNGRIALDSFPVPDNEYVDAIDSFEVTIGSDDLTSSLTLRAALTAALADGAPSTLDGQLAIAKPMSKSGDVQVNLASITGSITGSNVPTSIMQPFVAKLPVSLEHDLGPVVNLEASFAEGNPRPVELTMTAAQGNLSGNALAREDGSIEDGSIQGTLKLRPALVADLLGGQADAPLVLAIDMNGLHAPPTRDGAFNLLDVGGEGEIKLTGNFAMPVPGQEDQSLDVSGASVQFAAPSLRESIQLKGGAQAAGGTLSFDQSITHAFNAQGQFDWKNAKPEGSITLVDLPLAIARPMLAAAAPVAALDELLDGTVNATINTSSHAGVLRADADVRTNDATLTASLERDGETIQIASAKVSLTVSPGLAAAFQEGSESPVVLKSPSTASVEVKDIALALKDDGTIEWPREPIRAIVGATDTTIEHSQLAEPVLLTNLEADLDIGLGDVATYVAKGTAFARRTVEDRNIARVRYDVAAKKQQDETLIPSGTISLDDIVTTQLESALGLTRNTLGGWVGNRGNIDVMLAGDAASNAVTINSNMPNLTGTLTASIEDDVLTVSSPEVSLLVQKSIVDGMLTSEGTENPLTSAGDVSARATIKSMRAPLAAVRGKKFDPAAVDLNVVFAGGPLALQDATGSLTTLDSLTLTATTENLADGVRFTMNGAANEERDGRAGTIDMTGSLVNLIDEKSRLDSANARINLDANVKHLPTAIADALITLEGLLVAAVGPEMNAHFVSNEFSTKSGWLDADINTTNGNLRGRLRGRDDALITSNNDQLRGTLEITPPLRDRLLQKIHPILADVRTTEQPLRIEFTSNSVLPLDGDLSRMKGDFTVTVGNVEFDTGSTTLKLMRLFESRQETIPGVIEPIKVKIRNGIVTYEQFIVRVGQYTMTYEGEVNLVKGTIDLRTDLPVIALASDLFKVKELKPIEKERVPIYTRGTFEKYKSEPDGEVIAALVAKALLAEGLGGLLEKK